MAVDPVWCGRDGLAFTDVALVIDEAGQRDVSTDFSVWVNGRTAAVLPAKWGVALFGCLRPIYRSDADALMRMFRMEYTYPPMRFVRDWLEIDYNGHTIRGATVPGDNCSAEYDKQTAELSHLGKLHKSGLLSEADFETTKGKVLDT